MENNLENQQPKIQKTFTLLEFRRQLGIPLVLAKKMIVWGMVQTQTATDETLRITESQVVAAQNILKNPWTRAKLFFRALGPGLITGAADDDPSGIGTYSYAGAKFGFGLIWMAPWLLPLMTAVQEACGRIGIVTNSGLAKVMLRHYQKWLVAIIIVLLLIANVINIGADISAMAASVQLLIPIHFVIIALILTVAIILLEVLLPYRSYAKFLKWLTISLFAYVITGFIIHPDWLKIFREALIPTLVLDKVHLFAIIALFGTTISPYLFFWQTSEEVEENKLIRGKTLTNLQVNHRITRMHTDVRAGMFFANLTFFFIVLTTAQVLAKNGITNIETAEQAALALKPFAGDQAFLLFTLGIIGTGLLAVPILAGSGAYALSELMNWQHGLNYKFNQAKAFYWVIILSILIGLGLNFIGVSPMKALILAAFVNGVIAIPLLVMIMVIGNDRKIMGNETHPLWVKFFGWAAVIFAFLAICAILVLNFLK